MCHTISRLSTKNLQIIKNHAYECPSAGLVVAPYPTQDILATAYLRFKAEGLLPLFFHEDETPLDLYQFLTWCMEAAGYMMGAYQQQGDQLICTGIGKVGKPHSMGGGYQKAEVAMMFFREFQVRDLTMPTCQMMIEMVFDRTNLDVLFGTTAERNRAALRFMKAIGFEYAKVGCFTTWQGQMCATYASWMSEEKWRTVSPFIL